MFVQVQINKKKMDEWVGVNEEGEREKAGTNPKKWQREEGKHWEDEEKTRMGTESASGQGEENE